jgi:hypothetical protein
MTLLAVLPRSRTDNLKGRGATLTVDKMVKSLKLMQATPIMLGAQSK